MWRLVFRRRSGGSGVFFFRREAAGQKETSRQSDKCRFTSRGNFHGKTLANSPSRCQALPRKRLRLTRSDRSILRECSICTCCRVKGFASRGCPGKRRADVLRVPVAFHEGQWVLHWVLNGLEEAVVGA